MQVNRIKMHNFRNVLDEEICFQKGINVLYGKNASGKTNALEAIYLFASGKSLRGSPEKDFIRKGGAEFARLSLDFESESAKGNAKNMSLSFLGNNRKVMKYGYSDVARMSELLGHFRACVFTPDDIALVKGAPEERRRFADISISQISPKFVHCLNDYFRVLAQKNAVLKNYAVNGSPDRDYLEILNEQLAAAASIIVKQRYGFCENLALHAQRIYSEISDDKESFGMRYISQTKQNFSDEEYTKEAYLQLFARNVDRELKYGMSVVGPQKDDIYFCIGKNCELEMKEEDDIFESCYTAKSFGSRGQQRSVVLALKLAQGELFRELCGEYPVFLLDDVFSELDYARRSYILSDIENKQIIITCCDCDILGNFEDYHGIYVENGEYRQQ